MSRVHSRDRLNTLVYRLSESSKVYKEEIEHLISQYRSLVTRITESAEKTEKGWVNPQLHERQVEIETMRTIKNQMKELGQQKFDRNILKFSSHQDKNFDHGKDNRVSLFGDGTGRYKNYLYKESVYETEATEENLIYLQRKYSILKTYLGDIIPRSAFVLGEHSRKTLKEFPKIHTIETSIITIQKRVHGKNLQKMTPEERLDPIFLSKLQIAHRKYILLKIFIQSIASELGYTNSPMDVKMDLGQLSDVETLDINHPATLVNILQSPNIMYDGEHVYFIDLDRGVWDEQKESIYHKLLSKEVRARWSELQKILRI